MHAAAVRTLPAVAAVLSNPKPNASNPMKVLEYLRPRSFEEPFILANERWQYVTVKRADGQEDIGVYRFATDLCYDYSDFRALFNLA